MSRPANMGDSLSHKPKMEIRAESVSVTESLEQVRCFG